MILFTKITVLVFSPNNGGKAHSNLYNFFFFSNSTNNVIVKLFEVQISLSPPYIQIHTYELNWRCSYLHQE